MNVYPSLQYGRMKGCMMIGIVRAIWKGCHRTVLVLVQTLADIYIFPAEEVEGREGVGAGEFHWKRAGTVARTSSRC